MVAVTTLASRPRSVDGAESTRGSWDPLLRPIAFFLLGAGLFLNADAIGGKPGFVMPNSVPLLLGAACVGIAVVLPRRGPVYLALGTVGVFAMCVLSVLWSRDEASSILWLRSRGMVTLGIMALVLVLPTADTIKVMRGFVRVVLLVTLFAVATEPLARIHIDPLGVSPPLKGWHGFFVHKNVMAAFLVVALATIIEFDKNRWTRWPSLAAIVFLFVVSDSTTGRMAAMVLIATKLWFAANRRLNSRSSAAFAASTAALLAVTGIAIGASLSAIADAAGKDLTFTGRTKIWAASWQAFLRDPILGHGVNGLFGTPHTSETARTLRDVGFQAGHPHNGLLDVGVQLGVVGLVLVVGVIISLYRSSLRLQVRSPEVAAWALCIVSGIVIMSVGESVFLGSSIAVFVTIRTLVLRETRATPRGLETAARRPRDF